MTSMRLRGFLALGLAGFLSLSVCGHVECLSFRVADAQAQQLGPGDDQQLIDALHQIGNLLRKNEETREFSWTDLSEGWALFVNGKGAFIADMAIVLLVAIFLAAVIAYHPLTREKASSISDIEQPKTFIMYSMVGAVVAQIVKTVPEMALVIFGIGGLLRFRTDVGEAKDTGRVILVTVVGLCCGLKIFPVAFLATGFGWMLIWALERQKAGKLLVKGLEREAITKAHESYSTLLKQAGCGIIGGKKNLVKGQISFVFKAPRRLDRDALEHEFTRLPKEIRGAIDWDIS